MRRESATTGTWLLVLAVATGASIASVWLSRQPGRIAPAAGTDADALLWIAGAWIAIGVGLETMRRDRRDPAGLLVAIAGIAWLIGAWADPAIGSPVLFTIGLVGVTAYAPVLVHATLALVRPRDERRMAAGIILLGYGSAIALVGIVPALLFDPLVQGCAGCPANLVGLLDAPDLARAVTRIGLAGLLVWACASVALIGDFLRRASAAARRVDGPILVPAAAFTAAFAIQVVRAFDAAAVDDDATASWLWRLQAVALTAAALGVVYRWVRARRTRDRVARFVIDLVESGPRTSLRDVLAELVGDPELRVAYPMPSGRWVDAHGREASMTERAGRRLTPVRRGGEVVAVLDHRAGIETDPTMMDELVRASRLGLERERLLAAANATVAELRASRQRVVEADDAGRNQLERDLHDGAQQRLLSLGLALRLAESGLAGERDAATDEVMARAQREVAQALAETRRIAHGIYPASLADEGLAGGIESVLESSAIPVTVSDLPTTRFAQSVERVAYLVAAAAIGAAGARHATLSIRVDGDRLIVEVGEDGRLPDSIEELRDRVAALSGTLATNHHAGVGSPLIIRAEIPCAS